MVRILIAKVENLASIIVIVQLKDISCSLKLKVDFSRKQIHINVNRNLDSLSAIALGGMPLAHHFGLFIYLLQI